MPLDRRSMLAGLLACPVCARMSRAENAAPHWTYEGHGGAEEWGKLDSKFQACAIGVEQSPIDLKKPMQADVGALKLDWAAQSSKVVNNGHTIQCDASGAAQLDGEAYELKQFHFHTPSEHALDGKRTEMEAHFVHASASGKLAVVGVFMAPGKKNDAFASIMAAAPRTEGSAALAAPVDPRAMLPAGAARFRYEGSLTTPPCSEVVDWNVFEQPIEVAEADIKAFKMLFPMNARPLQAVGRRFLLKG